MPAIIHPLGSFVHCPQCGGKPFDIANAKAKRCSQCGFVYYFNPSAACVAIITDSIGRVLVSRRAKEPARGTLDFPGGFVDLFETVETALRREVAEETGLEILSTEYLFSIDNIYPYSGFEVHTLDLFFRCNVKNTELMHPADDVCELMWIAPLDLNNSLFGLNSIRKSIPLLTKILSLQ